MKRKILAGLSVVFLPMAAAVGESCSAPGCHISNKLEEASGLQMPNSLKDASGAIAIPSKAIANIDDPRFSQAFVSSGEIPSQLAADEKYESFKAIAFEDGNTQPKPAPLFSKIPFEHMGDIAFEDSTGKGDGYVKISKEELVRISDDLVFEDFNLKSSDPEDFDLKDDDSTASKDEKKSRANSDIKFSTGPKKNSKDLVAWEPEATPPASKNTAQEAGRR